MPSRSSRFPAHKPENKAFVVILSALQLAAVVLVWLLALAPVALMALSVTAWKLAAGAFAPDDGARRSLRGLVRP